MGPEGIHFMAVLTAIISIFPVRILPYRRDTSV